MSKPTAITIWVDESTELLIEGEEYNLVGYLITNSDKEEFEFLNKLKQARKKSPVCWTTLHGSQMSFDDAPKIDLIKRWIEVFDNDSRVCFHAFLYKKNANFISRGQTYEHYFAKQSVFSLANKMKKTGEPLNTMFSEVGTLRVLFDRRRAHSVVIRSEEEFSILERLNELENTYKEEIQNQIKTNSGKDSSTSEFTVRFSFLSSDCFDALQFTDVLLYLIRQKLEGNSNKFTDIFDECFLKKIPKDVQRMGIERVFAWDQKFNIFKSSR